jgi:predicted Zn-dependent protease with MMP-like domain
MEKEKFDEYVQDALSKIPRKFKKHIQNIAVIIEDKPPKELSRNQGGSAFRTVLGIYHGIPFKHRGPFYGNIPPDVIVIYKEPIERLCHSEEEIKEKIREVIIHEIGHYFGLSEKELREIEEY